MTINGIGGGGNLLRVIATNASYTANIFQPWAVKTGDSTFDIIEAVSSNGGDVEFRVRGDGQVTADGSISGGGADYAEWFEKEEDIGSTSTTTSAFTTGTLPIGSTVKIINNGRIQGKGGNGRNLNHGEQGGDALNLNFEVTIDNTNGEIWSGGGGGGACAGGYGIPGGGAGSLPGTGGNPGTTELGGLGTTQTCTSGTYTAGNGGNPGKNGGSTSGIGTMPGGTPGDSIQTNGNTIIWLGGNTSPNVEGPIN